MSDQCHKNTIQNITILMAMDAEAQPIIESLKLKRNPEKINPKLPFKLYSGQANSLHIDLMVSGVDHRYDVDNIGSEAATLMAYETLSKLKPDLIISAGTAGGFAKKGATVGKVYLSGDRFVFHDRHVPIPGFHESAVGSYPALNVEKMAIDLQLDRGVISTGSSLEKSEKDIRVIDAHEAAAKEMEVAAIAWVAMLFDTPVFAAKSVTNLVDEENKSEEEFLDNLKHASQALHDKLLLILDYLSGKSILQLGA